jgi:diguanylate cyclase (GGDEF)-like protein
MSGGIRRLLTLVLPLALLATLAGLVVLAAQHSRQQAAAVRRADRVREQQNFASLTGQYLRFAERDLQSLSLSRAWSLRAGDPEDHAALAGYLHTTPVFGYATVLADLTGRPLSAVADGPLPKTSDPAFAPLRRALFAGQPGVSSVLSVAGRPLVAVALPVMHAGVPAALLVGFADLRTWPLEVYARTLSLGAKANYWIVDPSGRVVVSSDGPDRVGGVAPAGIPLAGGIGQHAGLVWSAAPTHQAGWIAATSQPANVFYGQLDEGRSWLFAALAALILAGAVALTVLDHRRRCAVDRLAAEAVVDPLTGAGTRRMLDLRLPVAIARSRRAGTDLGLLFCDLDGFKGINDRLGHQIGDELLVAVSAALRATLREEDMLARVGGDEFVILVEGVTDDEHIRRLARRIVRELAEPIRIGARLVSLTVSVGAAILPADSPRHDELLTAADAVMYSAKRNRTGWEAIRLSEDAAPSGAIPAPRTPAEPPAAASGIPVARVAEID